MNHTDEKGLAQEQHNWQNAHAQRKQNKTSRERDCPYCLYWNDALSKCPLKKCPVFDL